MVAGIWKDLLGGFADLVCPRHCHLCEQPLAADRPVELGFCERCQEGLQLNQLPSCRRCGASTPINMAGVERRECSWCRDRRYAFSSVTMLGPYDGLLRETVITAKYDELLGLALGRLLATTQAAALETCHCDLVVPIPAHWRRRLVRGGNSAEMIAQGLATQFSLRTASLLKCSRMTAKQGTLSSRARAKNMRGAFRAKSGVSLRGRSVLLVDDVMTSGATANEAARRLRQAGAGAVHVAVIARGGNLSLNR